MAIRIWMAQRVMGAVMIVLMSVIAHAESDLQCRVVEPNRAPSSKMPFNGVRILQLDSRLGLKRLAEQGYGVETVSAHHTSLNGKDLPFVEPRGSAWRGPSPSLRDQIFARAGLTAAVRGWDHFAKDQLFLRAQSYDATRLARKYPQLSLQRLQAMRRLIARGKADGRGA